jgi:RNA polymerase sigma-70 factor (ECF subfamily)
MKSLIERIREGDQGALGELYDRTSALVHGLCLRILREPSAAEEVTLDVYLQVWNQAAAYDATRGNPEGWLLVIARSRALDRLRAGRRVRAVEMTASDAIDRLEVEPNGTAPAPLHADTAERRRIVAAALEKVSAEEREVLGCAFYRGMSHSEIASFLRQPLGTVKSRIRSGLSKLRRSLAPLAAGGVAW